MAYKPQLPAAVLELAQLVPNEFDAWLTKHNVSLPALFSAYKSAQNDLELAISHDRLTYKHVPRAIYSFVAPGINLSTDPKKPPIRISPAARTQLETIFKAAQILKAEAVAKAQAAAAAKTPVDPKQEAETKANAENSAKVAQAMDLISVIVPRQAARDFFLANLHQLFRNLLTTDQANALRAGLVAVSNKEEQANQTEALAKALIRLAKIEDARLRRDQALQIGRKT